MHILGQPVTFLAPAAFQAGFAKAFGLGMLKSAPAVVDALAADPAKQAAYVQMVQTVWAPKHMAIAEIVRAKRHLVENSDQLWQMMGAMMGAFATGDKGSVGVAACMAKNAAVMLNYFEVYASCWQPVLANWVRLLPVFQREQSPSLPSPFSAYKNAAARPPDANTASISPRASQEP